MSPDGCKFCKHPPTCIQSSISMETLGQWGGIYLQEKLILDNKKASDRGERETEHPEDKTQAHTSRTETELTAGE